VSSGMAWIRAPEIPVRICGGADMQWIANIGLIVAFIFVGAVLVSLWRDE
jgi:hypothetical protein